MLHLETIESHTLDILRRLQGLPELSNTRLVGGTALALQLGHRISVDYNLIRLKYEQTTLYGYMMDKEVSKKLY